MRICFVLEHYHPYIGGAEKLFRSLVESLTARGHDVLVITTRFSRKLPVREIVAGVHVRRVRVPGRYLFTLWSFLPALRGARWADVVHTTSYNAALPAQAAARLCKKPVVITFHEYWGDLWRQVPFMSGLSRRLHRMFERFIVRRRYTRVVGVSQFTGSRLLEAGVPANRIRVIHNGIDYGNYQQRSLGKPQNLRCVYFGRLGVSKGIDLLLLGWREFVRLSPRAQLVLIISRRPPHLLRKVTSLARSLDIASSLDIRHDLSEEALQEELRNATCAIIPSLSEGFCFAAVECAALGVPVITSQRGALPEVISGEYVPIESLSPAGICKALKRAERGDWETKAPKRFDLADCVQAYLNLYEETAEATKASGG